MPAFEVLKKGAEADSHGLVEGPPISTPLTLLLVQIMIILVLCRLLRPLFDRFKQPPVISEIIAGIILGPSVMGFLPNYHETIFPTASLVHLNLFAQIGLILFMFSLGLEMDVERMWRFGKASLPISVTAILFPFACGALLSVWFFDLDKDITCNFTPFLCFLGASMTFTAFPVMARILSAQRILHSPLGVLALSCAAFDDVMGWCTLALTMAIAANGPPQNGFYALCLTLGLCLFEWFVMRRIMIAVYEKLVEKKDELNRLWVAFVFFHMLLASWYCEVIGIHAFFGAFIAGIVVPKHGKFGPWFEERIELVNTEVFLPLYFTISGIRTDIPGLPQAFWGAVVVAILFATFAKMLPVFLLSWAMHRDQGPRQALSLAVLMNTRGMVEIVALNAGLSAGILTTNLFTVMIIMAIVTTVATPVLIHPLYSKPWHLQQAEQAKADTELGHKEALTHVSPSPAIPAALQQSAEALPQAEAPVAA